MGLASNLLNKPVQVVLANSTGDSADPVVVTGVLGAAAAERLTYSLTVQAGQQTSSVANVGANTAVSFATPSALTSTAATVQVSVDGATWVTLKKNDGTAYSLTVAASFGVPFDVSLMLGWQYVRLVMGTAEASARVITLIARPI